jgi:hypothetical protein
MRTLVKCHTCDRGLIPGTICGKCAALGSSEAREEVITADAGEHYPPHYQLNNGQQSLDFIEATLTPEQFEGFLRGNVLKYTIRYDRKGQAASDLRKAQDYATRLEAHSKKHA